MAACFLEESADLQLRMLSAVAGDGSRLRAFTAEEAQYGSDLKPHFVSRAWEYYATVAVQRPLGG